MNWRQRTMVMTLSTLICVLFLSGCPLFGADYVPDGVWRGTMTDAPGTITIAVQDGYVRVIEIDGLELVSPDDPDGVVTSYAIYNDYGFIDVLVPGVEGLPILPTGTFIDYAITEDGGETIAGTIAPDLSASGLVTIVLFAYNAPDETYEFAWTAGYDGEIAE